MSVARFAMRVLAVCCTGTLASAQSTTAVAPQSSPTQLSSSGQSASDTYDSWMAKFKKGVWSGTPGQQIELAVNIVDDDLDSTPVSMTKIFMLSTTGMASMSRWKQSGGSGKIPEADFKRFTALMAQLPDDHSWLPPKGRRLVVQIDSGNGILARVYDRANLPETVIEMADLFGADAWPFYNFPRFQPDARGKESLDLATGTPAKALDATQRVLAISPNQRLRALEMNPSQYFNTTVEVENLKKPREAPFDPNSWTTLRIEDAQTGAVIHEFREPMIGRSWIFVYAAQFTPDNRHLLVLSSIPDLRIYDTTTWQKVDSLHGIPAGAVAYDPAPDWKYGVAVFPSGEIALIKTKSGQKLAQIDPGNKLQSVAFSPDESRVAIVTVNNDPHNGFCHLRIWDTRTGRLLRELLPLEGTPRDGFGPPIWWPDGKYLFALTRKPRYAFPAIIGIWNTESGRYRGGLTGLDECKFDQSGLTLENGKFYLNCQDAMLMWNGDRVLEKIADFERSLIH